MWSVRRWSHLPPTIAAVAAAACSDSGPPPVPRGALYVVPDSVKARGIDAMDRWMHERVGMGLHAWSGRADSTGQPVAACGRHWSKGEGEYVVFVRGVLVHQARADTSRAARNEEDARRAWFDRYCGADERR